MIRNVQTQAKSLQSVKEEIWIWIKFVWRPSLPERRQEQRKEGSNQVHVDSAENEEVTGNDSDFTIEITITVISRDGLIPVLVSVEVKMLIDSSATVNTAFLFVEWRLMKKRNFSVFYKENYSKEITSL
jgi:hypothetical protein